MFVEHNVVDGDVALARVGPDQSFDHDDVRIHPEKREQKKIKKNISYFDCCSATRAG
jgi:hypothetical protein